MSKSKAVAKAPPDWSKLPRAKDKKEIQELPTWVKVALTRRVILDLTYKEAAEECKRAESTLADYGCSEAAKKWVARIQEIVDDPLAISRMVMEANAVDVTTDRFLILEAAKAEGDWTLADRIARDLQDRMGLVAQKAKDDREINVKISLGGVPLDIPTIEAEYEVVGGEDDS